MAGLEPSAVGDPDGRSAKRAIQMHEFLMTGGIKVGEREGIATYSDPIDHHAAEWEYKCPWHGETCTAWTAIVSGNGHWTKLEAELANLRVELEDTGAEDFDLIAQRAQALTDRLEMRPRDAKALRDRTPEMIAEERAHSIRAKAKRTADFKAAAANALKVAEGFKHGPNWKGVNTKGVVTLYCDAHRPRVPSETTTWTRVPSGKNRCDECAFEEAPAKAPVYAAAGPKRGGNPWDKMSADAFTSPEPRINYETGEVFDRDYFRPMYEAPEPEKDSRDDAVAAFADAGLPDTIEIDGDEGEEGDN